MVVSFDHPIVIYTNHEASSSIVTQIKLTSSNIDRLNMKLVRASIYLSQFRLSVHHKFDKSNIVSNALSRLSIRFIKMDNVDALDVDSEIYAYNQVVVMMNDDFRSIIQKSYQEDLVWKRLLSMLRKLVVAVATKASSSVVNVSSRTIENSSSSSELESLVVELSRSRSSMSLMITKATSFVVEASLVTEASFVVVRPISIISTSIITKVEVDKSASSLRTDVDFCLIDDLIYHIKNGKTRLCIFRNTKSTVMRAAHDDCFHAGHHKAYARLTNAVYIHKLSRKLIIYIRHCS